MYICKSSPCCIVFTDFKTQFTRGEKLMVKYSDHRQSIRLKTSTHWEIVHRSIIILSVSSGWQRKVSLLCLRTCCLQWPVSSAPLISLFGRGSFTPQWSVELSKRVPLSQRTRLLGFNSVLALLSSTGPCCYFWMMMMMVINHRHRGDTVRCTIDWKFLKMQMTRHGSLNVWKFLLSF